MNRLPHGMADAVSRLSRECAHQHQQWEEDRELNSRIASHEVDPWASALPASAPAHASARVAVIVSHAVKPPLQERRGDGYLRTQNDRDARCYSWLPLHFCNVVVLFGWHLTGQFPLFLEGLARKVIPFDD